MTVTIPVLLGTTRAGGRSGRVARLVLEALGTRPGVAAELIDLAALELPVMRRRMCDDPSPLAALRAFAETLARADGLVIVAPEYKNGYPGSLKNALDYLDAGAFRRKPIGIATVSSGGFGGINCLAQLRLVCLAMGGLPIPLALPVSKVDEAVDEEGRALDTRLVERLDRFLEELLWYCRAIARERLLDERDREASRTKDPTLNLAREEPR